MKREGHDLISQLKSRYGASVTKYYGQLNEDNLEEILLKANDDYIKTGFSKKNPVAATITMKQFLKENPHILAQQRDIMLYNALYGRNRSWKILSLYNLAYRNGDYDKTADIMFDLETGVFHMYLDEIDRAYNLVENTPIGKYVVYLYAIYLKYMPSREEMTYILLSDMHKALKATKRKINNMYVCDVVGAIQETEYRVDFDKIIDMVANLTEMPINFRNTIIDIPSIINKNWEYKSAVLLYNTRYRISR